MDTAVIKNNQQYQLELSDKQDNELAKGILVVKRGGSESRTKCVMCGGELYG